MKKTTFILCLLLLTSCGPSQEDKEKVAAVTCAVMGETRNMDASVRVEKINEAREKTGGEPFLSGDDAIREAFQFGLCEELILNENYDETLRRTKVATEERKREKERIAVEKRAGEERIAAAKRAEEERIAATKPSTEDKFHPNGQLARRTNYQAKNDGGKKDGFERKWHENGRLAEELAYKEGEKDGLERMWNEKGRLVLEQTYRDGKREDLWRSFWDNGQVMGEGTYKDGKREGLQRRWKSTGTLQDWGNFKDGKREGLYRRMDYKLARFSELQPDQCFAGGEEVDISNCQEQIRNLPKLNF